MHWLVADYLQERCIGNAYRQQLVQRLKSFCQFLGQPDLAVSAITCEHLNDWIQHLLDSGMPTATLLGYRRNLITLLNYAADRGLCAPLRSRRVKRPKAVWLPPTAWSIDEVRRLMRVARRAHPHWLAYCGVAYDTGLRRGDIWKLRSVTAEPFVVIEQKTGRCVVKACRPATVAAVDAAGGCQPPWSPSTWHEYARRLVATAGLKGTLKNLRRSHGTLVGTLDHADARTFRRHYFDPRFAPPPRLPPEIEDDDEQDMGAT